MSTGINYFPMDCNYDDDKMPIIEAKFGIQGFAVIVKLYQKIYGGQGYFCAWNERAAILFARSAFAELQLVNDVVEAALQEGIFDKGMYEKYGILTSHGIQKRFMIVVKRRRIIFEKPEYLLLNENELSPEAKSSIQNVNQSQNPVDNCMQNASNCMHDVYNSNTSKVKQSEVKQSEVKQSEVKQSEVKQSEANKSEAKQTEFKQSEAKQTALPAAAACNQDILIAKFGAQAVGEYEERFRRWKNKQGGVHVDMYPTIARWLEQDGVTKPLTSIDRDDILRELREQYASPPA